MSVIDTDPTNAAADETVPIGPTPALRADAAMNDAITSFKSMASGISVVFLFLFIGVGPSVDKDFLILLPAMATVWAAFTAASFYPQSKANQPVFRSGIEQAFPGPNWMNRTLGLVLCGAFAAGLALYLSPDVFNVNKDSAYLRAMLCCAFGQSAGILLDMLRGVQQLSFARAQLRSTPIA